MTGLEPYWNGDASLATLQPAPVFPELYQELWWYSGSYASISGTTGQYLQRGSTSTTSTATPLYTFSSNWPVGTQAVFECALWSTSGYTASAKLVDTSNSNAVVATITSNSTSANVIRSSTFSPTPGHKYGVFIVGGNSSASAYITDASLIVFPSSPLISPSVSAISLANPSGNTLKESYIPLWVYSSGSTSSGGQTSAGVWFVTKGTTGYSTSLTSATKLFNLSSNWSPSQKFAFECSIYSTGSTSYVALWDCTSNTIVSSSQLSTTSTTATLLRSASFTLTPGHWYGVTYWNPTGGSASLDLTKAHLVALAN